MNTTYIVSKEEVMNVATFGVVGDNLAKFIRKLLDDAMYHNSEERTAYDKGDPVRIEFSDTDVNIGIHDIKEDLSKTPRPRYIIDRSMAINIDDMSRLDQETADEIRDFILGDHCCILTQGLYKDGRVVLISHSDYKLT